jgi:hypothetical protein
VPKGVTFSASYDRSRWLPDTQPGRENHRGIRPSGKFHLGRLSFAITGRELTSRSTKMHPIDGQSSHRSSAGSSRFPKSVACISATSGRRPDLASPGQSSPTSSPHPAPSGRSPSQPELHLFRGGPYGPKLPTALPSIRCLQSPDVPGCRERMGRRQPNRRGFLAKDRRSGVIIALARTSAARPLSLLPRTSRVVPDRTA